MTTPPPLPSLVDPREDRYFTVLLVISILIWGLVVVTCIGLPYILLIGFFLWLANGLLVARLRSEGVEITAEQEPGLYRSLQEVGARLGLTTLPRLYIIQAEGALNAFTTRHSSRNFIVIYSDMLQACGSESAEVKFVLGHEIGHIQRQHVLKYLLLLPGRIMPLIGDAYSRACERTCDRYGATGAVDPDGAIRAMMMLSAGPQYGKTLNAEKFAAQHFSERGFFVSWHELTSAYPTLSQRVATLLAIKNGASPQQPPRHPLAYVFALFTLSGPGGGFASMLLTMIVILCLAAPFFIPALERSLEHDLPATEHAIPTEPSIDPEANNRVLEAGIADPKLVGTWFGKESETFTWTTTRDADGSFQTKFDEKDGTDTASWTQSGKWRVLDGVYYEITTDGENREYPIRKITDDRVIFGEQDTTDGTTFEELRVARSDGFGGP